MEDKREERQVENSGDAVAVKTIPEDELERVVAMILAAVDGGKVLRADDVAALDQVGAIPDELLEPRQGMRDALQPRQGMRDALQEQVLAAAAALGMAPRSARLTVSPLRARGPNRAQVWGQRKCVSTVPWTTPARACCVPS